jgi:hypothetical protein
MFRYMVDNAIAGPDTHYAETEAGALWLARWLAASFAARTSMTSGYNVYDLLTTPPTLVRSLGWDPPTILPFRPHWPFGWSYREF